MDLLKDEDQNYSYEIALPQLYLNLKKRCYIDENKHDYKYHQYKKDLC